MTRFGITLVACLVGCVPARAQEPPETMTALAVSFDHPPIQARPLGWWDWVNGNVTARIEVTFREQGLRPEVWDPLTGARADAPIFHAAAESISLPFDLEPDGSVFVVFLRPLPSRWLVSADPVKLDFKAGPVIAATAAVRLRSSDGAEETVAIGAGPVTRTLTGPWRVDFTAGAAEPFGIDSATLFDWAESQDARIRHHAGTAVYRTEVALETPAPGEAVVLDLGRVADIAQVFVNGRDAGVAWHPPFRVDITEFVRGGANQLELRIANRWVNRLIGDATRPALLSYQPSGKSIFTDGRLEALPEWFREESERRDRLRGRVFTSWQHWDRDAALLPSGLLGPVVVSQVQKLPARLASPTAAQPTVATPPAIR